MLSNFYVEEHVNKALEEDIGFGDVTTDYLVDEKNVVTCFLKTRADGIFCGKNVFKKVFEILSKDVLVKFYVEDGAIIKSGDVIAELAGPAKYILLGERVGLNYVQRMSGIATETNKYVQAVKGLSVKISDTRKTTPLFRAFEKYSVKIGGGSLHRFNLADCVMIKDNHIKYAGSITAAVSKIREHVSHAHKIEVECDTVEQVKEAINCNVDIIMLDNMTLDCMSECVKIINHSAIVEASGNVNLDTVRNIAETGVDVISTSAIVAKAPALDLGFDM